MIRKGNFKGTWSIDHTGLVRKHGKVYVHRDEATIAKLLKINHDDPWQGGHSGRDRTSKTVSHYYWWSRMKHEIRTYIDRYDIYQRMIIRYYKLYRKLMPLLQPE